MLKIVSILSIIIIIHLGAFALSPELQKDYLDFRISYAKIFDVAKDQKTFFDQFMNLKAELEKRYEQFVLKEKSEVNDELSIQGNQMALDLEMLAPLEELAKNRPLTQKSCSQAVDLNQQNANSSKDSYKKVQTAIQSLCKNIK